jgi:hypothetical protein
LHTGKHCFNVNNWGGVDDFNGADPQSVLCQASHADEMKDERIGAVTRSRRELSQDALGSLK